ncbi:hypothetical protein TNCV_4625571 [Trichonephila clavipes]|nr:hypothetical protein TNCV_4625571 [Trichonephila clavipes]
MGTTYQPGIKATANGTATHILSRLSQNQTNAVNAQNYKDSVLSLFCWWTFCQKEQRSTQVPSATLYGSSEDHCKTNGATCYQKVFCSYTIAPDLAPGDFHLFRYLKRSLGGKRFSDYEEKKVAVNSWLSDKAADFFDEGFQNLVLSDWRMVTCQARLGDDSANLNQTFSIGCRSGERVFQGSRRTFSVSRKVRTIPARRGRALSC